MSTPGRQFHDQAIHFLRKTITYATENTQVFVGTLPAGAVIVKPMSGVMVTTVFNDSGTDTFDIGTTATADLYGTVMAGTALNFVALDENVSGKVTTATGIYVRYNGQNNNASAGEAEVIIAYVPATDSDTAISGANSPVRRSHMQVVHYLRKSISYADGAAAKINVGKIPSGSLILQPMSGIAVTTVYTAGTNNLMQLGTSDNTDLFGTNLSLATAGFVPCDEAALSEYLLTSDTLITAEMSLTGTAAGAGAAEIIIAYIPDIDG